MKYAMLLTCSALILISVIKEQYELGALFCFVAWGIDALFE